MVFGMEQEIVDEIISWLLEEGYLLSFGPFNDFLFCIFTDCDIEGVIRSWARDVVGDDSELCWW